MEKCPVCNVNELLEEGANALSRKDNDTEICSSCAVKEAMEELKNTIETTTLNVGDIIKVNNTKFKLENHSEGKLILWHIYEPSIAISPYPAYIGFFNSIDEVLNYLNEYMNGWELARK